MKKIAVIFAAGVGKRFQRVTTQTHKSLMVYDGLTVIEHIIENLIATKNVTKIIIVTGYQAKKFEFLSQKYEQVSLRYNQRYKEFGSAYALNLIINELQTNQPIFFITGDFIMKQNCFLAKIEGNLMAAVQKTTAKDDWCYQLNETGSIIGLEKTNVINNLLASEWSHLSPQWAQAIAIDLQNQDRQEHLKTTIVGTYLITIGLQHQITIKPFLLDHHYFWDIDTETDWKKLEKK